MVLQFVLLAGLAAAEGGATRPPRPDFARLIPPASSSFFGRIRDCCDPRRAEAAALARYFDRCWSDTVDHDDYGRAIYLSVVVCQFDNSLLALNPNPTVGEAIARVGAYQPVLALVQREIERDDAHPKQLRPGQLCPLRLGRDHINALIARQYAPVLVKAVFGVVKPLSWRKIFS